MLTACAGAPGWIMNPPENPDELVRRFENANWEVLSDTNILGTRSITAVRGSHSFDEIDKMLEDESFDGNTDIWMEAGQVSYFTGILAGISATMAYEVLKAFMTDTVDDMTSEGVSASVQIRRTDNRVSLWIRVSGRLSVFADADFDIEDFLPF